MAASVQRDAARLTVPANPAYARAVRMFAASLAVVGELSVDEVEDLRMAAEEGFVYACATAPEQVELSFTLEGKSISIEYALGEDEPDDEDPSLAYSSLLLSAVCDRFEVDRAGRVLLLSKTGLSQ